jgi:hypothetical protein
MLQFEDVDDENCKEITNFGRRPFVKITSTSNPNNYCVLTKKFDANYAERIKKFEVYPDDVWIISNPKCGTTWTMEMVWLINNSLNYDVAQKVKADDRVPFLE